MLNRRRSDRNRGSSETSLVARGTVIRGDLSFSGALHLDGRIEGTVLAEGDDAMFTLSEHGEVQGEVRVPRR
ncbi:Cell shape determination protein CcmA OS=Rhodanobacter lindaniclasticus OX=75310 GN=B1991_03160 PE=4 SV=1 [Rhodanobacter lindaniclasticus]